MNKFKLNDEVIVIAGDDKNKVGKIQKFITATTKEGKKQNVTHAVVQGINEHTRRRKASLGRPAQVSTVTLPIHISNIAHIDPSTKKPTRIRIEADKKGVRSRIAVKSKKAI